MNMYTLKEHPEDFVVKERMTLDLKKEGSFAYFKLTKKGMATYETMELLSKFLIVPLKKIGFAGAKDKEAVTEQFISVPAVYQKRLLTFEHPKIKLEFVGYGNEPIAVGTLEGNDFTIVVRNIEKGPKPISWMINYFDEQRFSTKNVEVGRAIIKEDFKKACSLIEENRVKDHLVDNPTDFVGALTRVPLKLLSMYVHAYQSYLFNEVAAQYVKLKTKEVVELPYSTGVFVFPKKKIENMVIPIVGFGAEFEKNEIYDLYQKLMEQEQVTTRNFIFKKIPHLSAEGSQRDLIALVENFTFRVEDDEKHRGMKKCTTSFSLPKGAYATIAIRMMFLE